MTALTALEVVGQACDELGLPGPDSLVGSSDMTVKQLLALLNKEGRQLSARFAWQVMTWEITFVTVADEDQGSILTMADAIDQTWRFVLNDTMWDRDRRLPVLGPKSPWDWQLTKALNITQPFPEYRIDKNRLLLFPAPPAGHTIAFELVSRNWLTANNGLSYKEYVDHDDDFPVLDTDLLTQGILWRWRKAKELDYAEDFAIYERNVEDAITRDKSARKANLSGEGGAFFPGVIVSPGSWPLT